MNFIFSKINIEKSIRIFLFFILYWIQISYLIYVNIGLIMNFFVITQRLYLSIIVVNVAISTIDNILIIFFLRRFEFLLDVKTLFHILLKMNLRSDIGKLSNKMLFLILEYLLRFHALNGLVFHNHGSKDDRFIIGNYLFRGIFWEWWKIKISIVLVLKFTCRRWLRNIVNHPRHIWYRICFVIHRAFSSQFTNWSIILAGGYVIS